MTAPRVTVQVKDGAWRELVAKIRGEGKNSHVRVGVMGGGQHEGSDMTIAEIAAEQEFGNPKSNLPERSFIRATFFVRRTNALVTMLGKVGRAILTEKTTLRDGLEMLGQWGAAEVKNTITEIDIPPPLHPRTVENKGSSKPLVDTGQLLGAITHEVVDE